MSKELDIVQLSIGAQITTFADLLARLGITNFHITLLKKLEINNIVILRQ